jgi:hypothetical protein
MLSGGNSAAGLATNRRHALMADPGTMNALHKTQSALERSTDTSAARVQLTHNGHPVLIMVLCVTSGMNIIEISIMVANTHTHTYIYQ